MLMLEDFSRSTSKVFSGRTQRTETRNRAKDELKRVINAVDKVRKWYKKFSIHILDFYYYLGKNDGLC